MFALINVITLFLTVRFLFVQSVVPQPSSVIIPVAVSLKKRNEHIIEPKRRLAFDTAKSSYRNIMFWGKASRIYTSYKLFQVSVRATWLANKLRFRDSKIISNTINTMWNNQHEINSQRMLDLCLGLRGFYLKTGQFLGSRYDFMPEAFTRKLATLHDNVPPLPGDVVKQVLESEMKGPVENFFSQLELDFPIGSASVAQVHKGVWKATGQKCAVKIQYPNAEGLMKGDLRNLRVLAEFLQRTELKFDILSTIKELQKNVHKEFDFINEAKNMAFMNEALKKAVPEVQLPLSLFASKRAIVMTFVEGDNLGRLAEFSNKGANKFIPIFIKQKFGRKLLDVLSKAWGEMIFSIQAFNADPHPGNICIGPRSIGLLDWGQVKRINDDAAYKFALLVEAMNSRDQNKTCEAFLNLGVKVGNPREKASLEGIAVSMLDTRVVKGFDMDPFSPNNALKKNSVKKLPTELYFLVRTVQLMRGIAYGFHLDYSLSEKWAPYARKTIERIEKSRRIKQ